MNRSANMNYYNGITFKNIPSGKSKNVYTPKNHTNTIPSQSQSIVEEYEDEEEIQIILEGGDEMKTPTRGTTPHNGHAPRKHNPFQSYVPYNNRQANSTSETRPNNLYSKFCTNLVTNGECTYQGCTFAHTIKQYSPIKCKFNCGNRRCTFWHFWESNEEYIHRMGVQVPERILMEGMMQDAKNYKQEEILRSKLHPLETQLILECSVDKVGKEIGELHQMGYKNILLNIHEQSDVKVRVGIITDYIDFLNRVIPVCKMETMDKITNEDRKKLGFYLPQIPRYINHIKVVNGETTKIPGDILGDVNGWDTISQLQDLVQKYYPGKTYSFRCLEIEKYEVGGMIELAIIIDLF